jgi:hypothetical protein
LGEVKKREASVPDTIFGQVDRETGAVTLTAGKAGEIGNSHPDLGMYPNHGPVFRYRIPNKACYWWYSPSAKSKSSAEFALEQKGYEVKSHRVMTGTGLEMMTAHGLV